jgi:hypothetical protein
MADRGWRLEASFIDSALDAVLDSALDAVLDSALDAVFGLRGAGMAAACGACVLGRDATQSRPSTIHW